MKNINGFILDRQLVEQLGLNRTAFICMMIDKYNFYKQNNQLDSNGYFFISRNDMQNETGLGLTAITKYTKEFSNAGVLGVEVINSGNKANRYTLLADSKEYILKNMSPIQLNISPIPKNISPIPLNTESTVLSNHINKPEDRTNVTTALSADNGEGQTLLRSFLTPLEVWMNEAKQYKHI